MISGLPFNHIINCTYFTTDKTNKNYTDTMVIITHVKAPVFHISISLLGIQITTNKPINEIEKDIGKMINEKRRKI